MTTETGDPLERLSPEDRDLLFGGPLSEADRLRLEQRAHHEPDLARALAYLTPLDHRFHRRVLTSVRGSRWSIRRSVPIRWVGTGLSAAAGFALFLFLRAGSTSNPEDFALEIQAGWRRERSEVNIRQMVEAGAPILLLARPKTPTSEPFHLRVYVPVAGGWRQLDGRFQRSNSGVLRLKAAWPPDATESTLRVIIGRKIPPGVPEWLLDGRSPPAELQVKEVDLRPGRLDGSSPGSVRNPWATP